MPGAGSIYRLATGEFVGTIHDGDAAGLAVAKTALAAGGLLQMGPGTEGIALGVGWGVIALARIDATGRMFLSRFHMTDGTDPTKSLFWDVAAITAATIRTVTVGNYSGFLQLPATMGVSGEMLMSVGGGQPVWQDPSAFAQNNLLDGVNHLDTIAQACSRGSLIKGNADATAKWDELVIGAANTVLTSNGTDASWSANPAIAHEVLSHLKPIAMPNCSWTTATDVISAAGLPGQVKIGDYVYVGDEARTQNQGRMVTAFGPGANEVTVSATNGSASISNKTFIFQPGDHFDDTLAIDSTGTGAGLFLTGGRGTYNATDVSGTFQEIRGPVRWRGHGSTAGSHIPSDFRVAASGSTSTLSGFCIDGATSGATGRVYFFVNAGLVGNSVIQIPDMDPVANVDSMALIGLAQTFTNKTLTTATKLVHSGNGSNCVIQSGGGADRLDWDVSNLGQLIAPRFPDMVATDVGTVQYDYVKRTTAIDGKAVATTNLFTVPAGKSFITTRVTVRCTAATAITIWPTYGVGVAAGEDDIIASTAHAIAGAANTFILQNPKEGAVVATSTQIIKLGIDAGATGTSMTLAVDIQGYLV